MYPNLLGQKAYHHLTDKEMGQVIGVSRNTYSQKIRSGRFSSGLANVRHIASTSRNHLITYLQLMII